MKNSTIFKAGMLAAVLLIAASSAASQEAGRGKGYIHGIITDAEGKILEGIKVEISFDYNPNVRFQITTNTKGEWSFIGLATGKWSLTATHQDYDPVAMPIRVTQLEANPKIEIKMKKIIKVSGFKVGDQASLAFLEESNQLYREQKYGEALARFEQFLEKNPGVYQVQLSIADCHREMGELDKASQIYGQLIEEAKADPEYKREMAARALAGLGQVRVKQEKLAEAQDLFKQSIEKSPKDEILAYNVGEICFSNRVIDEALKYFRLASEIKPTWPDPYLKMGYAYLNNSDMPNAIASFEKFLALEPNGERAEMVKNILAAIKK